MTSRRLLFRLRALFTRQSADHDLAEEMATHLDLETARLIATGLDPAEARARARREFGNLAATSEAARASWQIEPFEYLMRNSRIAIRSLLRRPALSLTAILSLALGIGAATTVFSVVNSLLLRPLPYRNAPALVAIWPNQVFGNEEIDRLRRAAHSYAQVASFSPGWLVALSGVPEPRQLNTAKVSGNFFAMLGVVPALGRAFDMAAETPGNDLQVVLGEELWRQSFGGDPNIVGRSITLDGLAYTVVGVMPRSFKLLDNGADAWVPMAMDRTAMSWAGSTTLALGELRPGVTAPAAEHELRTLAPAMQKDFQRAPNWGQNVTVKPLLASVSGGLTSVLTLLLTAVSLLWIIAVTNVVTLLLVRTAERTQELVVRTSLGASERQLDGLLLLEGMLLSIIGGVIGVALCIGGVVLLRHTLPASTPRLAELSVDWRVLVVATLSMMVAGVVFGVMPARLLRQGPLGIVLRRGRGQTATRGRLRGVLVAIELALALLLCAGAGLMGRTLMALYRVNRGLRTDHVVVMQMQPNAPNDSAARVFWHTALDAVRGVPGVQSAATMLHLPMSGRSWHADVAIDGRPLAAGAVAPRTAWQSVSANYFAVAGLPLLQGRGFSNVDSPDAPLSIVVNTAFAKAIFPGENPVGKRVQAGFATGKKWATIVGVVADMPHDSLNVPPPPEVYLTMDQRMVGATSLMVRTIPDVEPLRVVAGVRRAIAAIDRNSPVSGVRTLDDLYTLSLQRQRLTLVLLAVFSLAGTILGAVGIFGVIASGVRQRTREIGIRSALGANPRALQWVFVREGVAYALLGIAIGVPLAFIGARAISAMLFGVQSFDLISFGGTAALLLLVATLASWLPARRATKVNPATVLGGG